MSDNITFSRGAETEVSATDHGLQEAQDRFAITPLYTTHYKYALDEEFMCDPETGAGAIKHADGTVITENEVGRKNYHVANFETNLVCLGMRNVGIYALDYPNEAKVATYVEGDNLLDEPYEFELDYVVDKLCVSIDPTFLTNQDDFLRITNYNPNVTISYLVDGVAKELETTLNELPSRIIEIGNRIFTLSAIVLTAEDTDITDKMKDMRILIHSILLGF